MKPYLITLIVLLPAAALAQSSTNTDQPPGPPPGGQSGQGHPKGPPSADERLQRLTQALDLTATQQQEIKPILEAEMPKLKAIHDDTSMTQDQKHQQFKTITQDADKQIEEVLTVEQAAKFEQMEQKMHRPGGPPPPPQGNQ